jgi:Protein of unknown function (DUF3021).
MFKKIMKHTVMGISLGCTISSLINIIGVSTYGNTWFTQTSHSYISQTLAAILVGVAWMLPAIVYQNEKLSYGLKLLIHMTIGFIVYFPCAFSMGWISVAGGIHSVILGILLSIVISMIIWLCFFLYARKEAQTINSKIKESQR